MVTRAVEGGMSWLLAAPSGPIFRTIIKAGLFDFLELTFQIVVGEEFIFFIVRNG
jgi:hypothetical protein